MIAMGWVEAAASEQPDKNIAVVGTRIVGISRVINRTPPAAQRQSSPAAMERSGLAVRCSALLGVFLNIE
jgi:hypothetical protein